MRKRFGIISVLVAIMMMMNMITVSADVETKPDYVQVNVQQDGAKVTVDYSLTQAAVDAGLSFGTITTTIEGQAFLGAHVETSLYDLKVPAGTTVTADYSVELISSTKVESTTTVVSDTTTLMKVEVVEEIPADEEGAAPQVDTTTEWIPAVQTWEHNGWQALNGDFGRTKDNPPLWIWNAHKATIGETDELVEFKRSFNVSGTIESASLVITADNEYSARLNGHAIGANASWPTVDTIDVKDQLEGGENLLEINAINDGTVSNPEANPGGLIYKLTIVTSEVVVEVEEVVSGSFDLSYRTNLWVAADDYSTVYIDGSKFRDANGWRSPRTYLIPVSGTPFFAVEASDIDGTATVAGFRMEFYDIFGGEAVSEATDGTWYYYNKFDENGVAEEPTTGDFGLEWTDEDYANNDDWVLVNTIPTYGTWATDEKFPAPVPSSWIWGGSYIIGEDEFIHNPIYFRSSAPQKSVEITVLAEGYDAAVSVNGLNPTVKVLKDSYVSIDAPAVEGYNFLGWYEDGSLKYEGPQQNLQADMDRTFTAKYEIKTYVVTATANPVAGGNPVVTSSPVDFDGSVVLDAATASGYRFLNWTQEGEVVSTNVSFQVQNIQSDLDFVANYELIPPTPTPTPTYYTLTVNVVGDGTVPGFEGTSTYTSGTDVKLSAVIGDVLITEFEGWSGDLVSTNADVTVSMNGDKTVTATFVAIPDQPEEEPEEEILDEVTPEATPDEEIEDEVLPQTGGVPAGMMSIFGIAMTGLGFKIRKRK